MHLKTDNKSCAQTSAPDILSLHVPNTYHLTENLTVVYSTLKPKKYTLQTGIKTELTPLGLGKPS